MMWGPGDWCRWPCIARMARSPKGPRHTTEPMSGLKAPPSQGNRSHWFMELSDSRVTAPTWPSMATRPEHVAARGSSLTPASDPTRAFQKKAVPSGKKTKVSLPAPGKVSSRSLLSELSISHPKPAHAEWHRSFILVGVIAHCRPPSQH